MLKTPDGHGQMTKTQPLHSAANAGPIELPCMWWRLPDIEKCSCGCTAVAASSHSHPFTARVQHPYPTPWLARGREIRTRESSIRNTHLSYHPRCMGVCTSTTASESNVQGGDEVGNRIERLWISRQKGGSGRRCWREETTREGKAVALVVAVEVSPFTTLLHPRPCWCGRTG